MAKKWQLQEAKNRFSEVVEEAQIHGPQIVTRHGEDKVVILSIKDFRNLKGDQEESLADFFMNSPLRGSNLDIQRDKSLPRDISL
jgi:antitoxin Phd